MFYRLQKGEKRAFPSLLPPCNVGPPFELPVHVKYDKHPNFEWWGWVGVWIFLLSEVTSFEGFVSTTCSLIAHNVVLQISGATEMTLPVHDQLHILQTLSSVEGKTPHPIPSLDCMAV